MYKYDHIGTLLDNRLLFMCASVEIPMEEIEDYGVFLYDSYQRISIKIIVEAMFWQNYMSIASFGSLSKCVCCFVYEMQ